MIYKELIQKRVIKNGRPINLDQFEWDDSTNELLIKDYVDSIDLQKLFKDSLTSEPVYIKFNSCGSITVDNFCCIKGGEVNGFIKTGNNCFIDCRVYGTIIAGDNCIISSFDGDCNIITGNNCHIIGRFTQIYSGDNSIINNSLKSRIVTGNNCNIITGKGSVIKCGDKCSVEIPETFSNYTTWRENKDSIIFQGNECSIRAYRGDLLFKSNSFEDYIKQSH